MEIMMQKLKLSVNQQKTRVCRVPAESFDFLGYTLGQCHRALRFVIIPHQRTVEQRRIGSLSLHVGDGRACAARHFL
jgi:hypothetical protein